MKNQNGALAPAGSACPTKANELFFVIHRHVSQPLLGPFATAVDAECACALIGSPEVVVETRTVASSDDFVHGQTVRNGKVHRVFLGVDAQRGGCMNPPDKPVTFDRMPRLSARPDHATDYTGKQRGMMTAIAWHRPSRSGKATLWLCRCECGRYEYRRPGTWESKPHPDDRCDVCLHAKGPNAKQTARQRLLQWKDDLRCLGLGDGEISRLQAPGMNVGTKGKTLEEIREQIDKGPSRSA